MQYNVSSVFVFQSSQTVAVEGGRTMMTVSCSFNDGALSSIEDAFQPIMLRRYLK